MTTLTTSDTTTLPIYRYKFSDEFMGPLTEFSSKHRFDEATLFKMYWDRWESQPQNASLVDREERRLKAIGYEGDIHEKMYKTVRYYLKNKSLEKKEPKKRRKYITLDREFLEKMDDHILQVAMVDNMRLVDEQIKTMMEKDITEVEANNKIKKTYKNRYYLQQKN